MCSGSASLRGTLVATRSSRRTASLVLRCTSDRAPRTSGSAVAGVAASGGHARPAGPSARRNSRIHRASTGRRWAAERRHTPATSLHRRYIQTSAHRRGPSTNAAQVLRRSGGSDSPADEGQPAASLPSLALEASALVVGRAMLGKGEPAYSSDGIRCRGFRPAEAGEGACGPLRSPERAP